MDTEKEIKCSKCKGTMNEGVGLTTRGGLLFFGKSLTDISLVNSIGWISGILTWLTGSKQDSKGSRSVIKMYKCQNCGYIELYSK